jgi:hypothetical protein
MVAGFFFLILGAILGAFLRLPAFMALSVLLLAVYGGTLRHNPIQDVGLDVLVGLLAIQCGYVLTIIAHLLLSSGRRSLHYHRGADEGHKRRRRSWMSTSRED